MNKTLLVLGASSDVGQALIERVYDEYDIILAHYNRTKEPLELLNARLGGKVVLLQADFSSDDDTDRFISELKKQYVPTHIVHLPAPKYMNSKFHKIKWNNFQTNIDLQLRSISKVLSAFLPIMSKTKYGKIVIMLSSCSENTAPKYLADYVTVKYALLGLMKALAAEYASKNICVNGISPAMMDTKFLSDIPELIVQQNAAASPRGRNVSVNDVVPTIEFLLCEKSDYISGQNIVVAAGE